MQYFLKALPLNIFIRHNEWNKMMDISFLSSSYNYTCTDHYPNTHA